MRNISEVLRNEMNSDTARGAALETDSWTAPTDLGACVAGLINAVARGMAELVAPHGLTHIDFAVLRLFLGADEWTTMQMAQVLPLAPSGISRTVTKLVDMGLVRRRRLLSDRRVVILTMTDEGTALAADLQRRVQAYDASLCEDICQDHMAVFVSVTSRVMANHSALKAAGS